jgi:hypothetical protein
LPDIAVPPTITTTILIHINLIRASFKSPRQYC